MPVVDTEARYRNLAQVMQRVGEDVPYSRVLTYPAAGTATPEDACDPAIVGDRGVELVGGVLVEKAVGFYDEYIGARILGFIFMFLQEHKLGAVTGSQGGYQFAFDQMRMPDVSFVRWESVDDSDEIEERNDAFLTTPPDLVVEVVSPGNTA
jgi:Uma2 family endonuclease